MKSLDKKYRELILMRYILETQEIYDEEQLDKAVNDFVIEGNVLNICENIADHGGCWKDAKAGKGEAHSEAVVQKEKVPCISRVSMSRCMGLIKSDSEISISILNYIAKYLLCKDWTCVNQLSTEAIKEKLMQNSRIERSQEIRSVVWQDRHGSSVFDSGLQQLLSHNVTKNNIVNVIYGKNRQLKLRKGHRENDFTVVKSDSKILKVGQTIAIPFFFLGVNIIGLEIKENGVLVKDFYKSSGVVTSIKVERGL